MLGEWAGRLSVRLAWVGAIAVAFLWSLLLPVEYGPDGRGMLGILILPIGWMGVLQTQFGWFANIGLLVAIVMLLIGRRVPWLVALSFAVPTAACAINALFWREVPNSDIGHGFVPIVGFAPGYWLWLGVVWLSVAAMLAMIRPPIPRA